MMRKVKCNRLMLETNDYYPHALGDDGFLYWYDTIFKKWHKFRDCNRVKWEGRVEQSGGKVIEGKLTIEVEA